MSSHSLLLCALAAAAAASNPTPNPNPNLRFFSVWSGGAGGVSDPISGIAPSFVNFLFDVSSTAAFPKLQERGFGPSLLHVREVLFMDRHAPTRGLRPDYKERWNATLEQLRPLIASGAAMGVFLGDELCWDCVSHAELTTAAELVRATLPDLLPAVAERAGQARPVIYYNERSNSVSLPLWDAEQSANANRSRRRETGTCGDAAQKHRNKSRGERKKKTLQRAQGTRTRSTEKKLRRRRYSTGRAVTTEWRHRRPLY